MHLTPRLSRFKEMLQTKIPKVPLSKLSWKSPQVRAGVIIVVVLIGGCAYYFSTTTASANAATSNQQTIAASLGGYKLEVNGSVIAILPTKADVDKVLKDYQDYYVKPSEQNKVTSVSFAEKVANEKTEATPSQVQTPEQVLKMLIAGKSTTEDYTVQPNDSWWLIARKSNMLTKEVLAGNPGATEGTKITPGQTIKLVKVTPYLTVVSQGTCTDTEAIPYETVTKLDYSLGKGQSKVITQGSNGSVLVTYTYVRNNAKNIQKMITDEKILKDPVTKVVAVGPSSRAANVAMGISRGSENFSSLINHALSLVGTPYVFGGTSRNGFDCSGFTQYVFASSGVSLPRTSYAQFETGSPVSKSQLQPGDLVFFTTYTRGASHVGIYIGGGRFVHADNPRSGVTVSSLNENYYASHYIGARRDG